MAVDTKTSPFFWKRGKHANQNSPPILLKFRSSRAFIITTITLAIFTDLFLYGVIVPVLPFALESRSHVPHESLQKWTSILLAVYGAGLLVTSPIAGYLADRFNNRKGPLLLGLIALVASTAMFCASSSIALLTVARFLQGMSAAVIWTVGLALIVDTVPADSIAESMGYVQLGMSAGTFFGPLLGGIVYDKGGYYAVFGMAFGVIAVDIVLRLLLIEKKVAERYLPSLGHEGLKTLPEQNNEVAITYKDEIPNSVFIEKDNDAKIPRKAQLSFKQRMLESPVTLLFQSPRFISAFSVTAMLSVLTSAFDAVLPLRTVEIFNFDSTGAGLIFLPIIIPSLFGPIAGKLVDKYGPRWFTVLGFTLAAPPYILLRLPHFHSVEQIVLMCVFLFWIGFAFVLPIPAIITEVMKSIEDLERKKPGRFGKGGGIAQGYGLFNLAWSLGVVIGPFAGSIRDAVGWNTMCLIMGILSLAVSFVAIWYTGGRISRLDFVLLKKRGDRQDHQENGSVKPENVQQTS